MSKIDVISRESSSRVLVVAESVEATEEMRTAVGQL
jgi:hypothetical protein